MKGPVEFVDLSADKSRIDEMLKLSGGSRKVPLILDQGVVTVGFGGS